MRIAASTKPIPRDPPLQAPVKGPKSKPVTFTIATINDDFATKGTNLRRPKADVTMAQEAKNVDLHRLENPAKYGVHQHFGRTDQAGAALIWKKGGELKAGKRGYAVGVSPHGAAMLKRWINWTDFDVGGKKLRVISVHRPPLRFKRLWPEFDRNLAAFVKSTRGPVIVGMDANQRDPRQLARLTGLRWHAPKGSIDGFLASRSVTIDHLKRLRKGSSDHHPVLGRVRL